MKSKKFFEIFNKMHFKLLVAFLLFGYIPLGIGAMWTIGMFSDYVSEEELEAAKDGLPVVLWPLILLVIVFAIVISGRLVFPLKKLADNIRGLREGHFDNELTVNGCAEVWDIQDAVEGLREEAARLDARRDEFVSNVSHELKTPLASMKVLSDSLLSTPSAPPEVYREFLNDINSQIDRENKIITNLLSLIKMKSDETANFGPAPINTIVENIMRDLKPLAQDKNIDMVFESFKKVTAEIDEVKFSLVVSNLVENAIKYNHDGGSVKCSLNADHRYFILKVEDSGIGISGEDKALIFDRFYRVDKARSRETGGTGLGLSIVKEAVILHHGYIKVSDSELGGSLFTVKMPIAVKKQK